MYKNVQSSVYDLKWVFHRNESCTESDWFEQWTRILWCRAKLHTCLPERTIIETSNVLYWETHRDWRLVLASLSWSIRTPLSLTLFISFLIVLVSNLVPPGNLVPSSHSPILCADKNNSTFNPSARRGWSISWHSNQVWRSIRNFVQISSNGPYFFSNVEITFKSIMEKEDVVNQRNML